MYGEEEEEGGRGGGGGEEGGGGGGGGGVRAPYFPQYWTLSKLFNLLYSRIYSI